MKLGNTSETRIYLIWRTTDSQERQLSLLFSDGLLSAVKLGSPGTTLYFQYIRPTGGIYI